MSVGRQLCKQLISTAEDLRRYAALADTFKDDPDAQMIAADALAISARLEDLIRPILTFEGENMRELMPAASA